MRRRSVVVMLGILLLSYAPLAGISGGVGIAADDDLGYSVKRVEVAPDSDSIQDLGESVVIQGFERTRDNTADSTIGVYTELGLIPSVVLSEELATPRSDLAMVIVSGSVGMWDARLAVEEIDGVEIRSAIPPSGFLVQGDAKQLEMLESNSVVLSVAEVPAGLLVHPLLQVVDEGTIMVEILGWKDDDLQRHEEAGFGFTDSLSRVAELWMTDAWSPEEGRYWGEIELGDIGTIIQHPSVAWVAPLPVLELKNDQARVHMGIDTVETFFVSDLDGSGQKIAVGDSGLDDDHGDFAGRISALTSVTPGDSSTADLSDGHGTHVACTVLGSGMRSGGTYVGVAPAASLYMQAMEDDDSGTLYSYGINSMLNSAYNAGARLHTNSWGAGSGHGSYSTQSEDADDRTSTWDQYWSYEGMTVLFAAGNERDEGISPPGTAKNIITVGGHKNRYSGAPDTMYHWSSRGPTDDGRIKPDVLGPGDGVRSCLSQEAENAQSGWSNNWYIEYSGTSMSTPAVAGAATLVREYLMEVANRPAPQGALVKALLILGAKDMGTRNIPNNDEGWGRVDLVNSLVPDSDEGIFVDDRNRLKSGQTREYSFDITRSGEPLKVVLTWSDYPGSSSSSQQLRNDLNLEVVHPNGQLTYKGNVFNSGRSITGGNWDSKNNVEVVLIDSAAPGIWTIRVKDDYHSGGRTWQPFALAVRGVNVNDLSPDPAFLPGVMVSTPIPQIGEEVQLTVTIQNLGAGSVPDLNVMARADGTLISTKTVSMSPGESFDLSWNWTPTAEGLVDLSFHIDPNDMIEEVSETNNVLTDTIVISAPGVRVTSGEVLMILGDTTDSATSWQLTLTNTALFETNATIAATIPQRMADGLVFDWFYSFTLNTFNLQAAEAVGIGFTLVHPAPPEPGTYEITVTGTDIENDIESEIKLYFEVPVLASADINLPAERILVSPLVATQMQIHVTNEGNGPQTYDVELISPAGWHLGLDVLGAFAGSSHGSTGTLAVDERRAIAITINPPGAMIPAGTIIESAIIIHSRVSSDSWSVDMSLEVIPIDQLSTTPISDGIEHDLAPDANVVLNIEFLNSGNRDLGLTPLLRSIPGGWNVVGGLDALVVPAGSSSNWSVTVEGNGRAVSGDMKFRFTTEDGFSVDWNRTLDVLSGAIPTMQFHQVVLADGTSSDHPLGVGAHPVNTGFDLAWLVVNEGSSTWRPTTTIELPDEGWSATCSAPSTLAAGASTIVWCTMTIPLSAEAGSEPPVTLVMDGEGVEARHTITLLVDAVAAVEWSLRSQAIAHEGYSFEMTIDIENVGNSQINHRLDIISPSGWNLIIHDGVLVILSPGESRSIKIEFRPDSGSDGEIELTLRNADDVAGFSFVIQVDVMPGKNGSGGGLGNMLMPILILLILAIIGGTGFYVFKQRGGNLKSILRSEAVVKLTESLNLNEDESGSGIECWICSKDIFEGEAWACGSCGARYHQGGQVSGCDIVRLGKCLQCNAESDELVEV